MRDFDKCDWCGNPYLPGQKPRWIKTTMGFRRVHDDCAKMIRLRGEEIPSEQIYASNQESSDADR